MPLSLPGFQRRLLTWFDRNQRDLPWRHNREPYQIWVSEVMLQQTTVAAVIPYFQRFMAAFPTVHDLAAANEQDVLHHWQGLGYYRRAKHLHRAAQILADMKQPIPNDLEVWRELPGVGRYILGAVLSQAFDRRMPIVEANSQRVLCRLFGQTGDPKSSAVQKWLWETAERILPRTRIGDFNQALMELGALVCTPSEPRCGECPLKKNCIAFATDRQGSIPLRTVKRDATTVSEVALIIRKRDQVLLMQRRDDAVRWAGMWEFPRIEQRRSEDSVSAAKRQLRLLKLKAKIGSELLKLRYTVTRFRMTLTAVVAEYTGGRLTPDSYAHGKWICTNELHQYPQSTSQRKLVKHLRNLDVPTRLSPRAARV